MRGLYKNINFMNKRVSKIHLIGIGLGARDQLTKAAELCLLESARIYVMAQPDSWMIKFVVDIVGDGRVRPYMPVSVKWNSGWQEDGIFSQVVDEVEHLVAEGNSVAFAMAGDVAIYGNVADSILPRLSERNLEWDVYPGVSFLNALTMVTGEPIVGEADNFLVTFAKTHGELDQAFGVANVLVLYNPGATEDLYGYIQTRHIPYARMVVHGIYGSKGRHLDLTRERVGNIGGLVILKRPPFARAEYGAPSLPSQGDVLDHHVGANGWDCKGRFFATAYPNRLLWSPAGDPGQISQRFVFPDNPEDIRGFFIDSRDAIYVSLKGHRQGAFGRTYVSRDGGKNFRLAFEKSCWAFDEDRSGNLYAGVYHEKGEPDGSCSILWSPDEGETWTDIAPPEWRAQDHIHHLAVDPATGWLYACLGDKLGKRGCWRTMPATFCVARSAEPGSVHLELSITGGQRPPAPGDMLCFSNGARAVVEYLDGMQVRLRSPLAATVEAGAAVIGLRWIVKIADPENTLQFIGLVFKDGKIFLANDTGPQRNKASVAVFVARDDGTDKVCVPVSALRAEPPWGWGSFYFEMDRQGVIWVAVRPIRGRGGIWVSRDGERWVPVHEAFEEDLPCWRGTHTYRDGTLGQTGDGRYLSAQEGGRMILAELNRARQIAISNALQ